MRLRLLAPRYWPTWAGLGLLRAAAWLPFPLLVHLGSALGALVGRMPTRFSHVARRNIELCFPELSAHERERLVRRHFASLGMALLEVPLSWWGSTAKLARITQLAGAEHLHAAQVRGQGVILLTGHFTTMEIAGRTLSTVAPVSFFYRPTTNEVLAWALQRFRQAYGCRGIATDDIRAFIKALKNNECVWYAPDQSYRKKGAEMVPWFGIPAATTTFTPRLARTSGAIVLPYFIERLPGSTGYRAVIHPPLENFPSDDPAYDTERFNHLIEAQVRKVPEQYLWIHRRFKGLTADYPDYYGGQVRRRA
jgi:KDO2-lipid IV(A) lauroyltransferase